MTDEKIELIQHPSVKVIRRSEDYIVDGLGKVSQLTAIDPQKALAAKEPLTIFSAYAILGAQIQGQVRPFQVEWLMVSVNTVEEAFEAFQKQAIEQLKQNMENARRAAEAEQNRIVTASGIPNIK